jgi:hypothetical protein
LAAGGPLDRELLDLVLRQITEGMTLDQQYAAPRIPLDTDLGRRFLHARYNADLSSEGLAAWKISNVDSGSITNMDAAENIEPLLTIGHAAGNVVLPEHFGSFL